MMKKNSDLRKFLTNIYGFQFFDSLVFMYPLYTIFFSENGLSDPQISLLFIIWCFGIMLCQLPVGILADKFPKKAIIIAGQISKIACFMTWIMFPTFWGFALGFILWGFQGAVYNAVFEAVVYDELRARKNSSVYTKVCGHKSAIGNAARIIATTGSLMLFFGYDFVTYISAVSLLLAAFFVLRINTKAKQVRKKSVQFIKTLKLSAHAVAKKPYILYMMIMSTAIVAFSCFEDYFGLIGVEIGIQKEYVGSIFFAGILFQVFGQSIAHKFEKAKDMSLYVAISIFGAIMASFSIFYSIPGLILVAIPYFAFGALRVLLYARFQHSIPSVYRSTVLSLYSFVEQSIWTISYLVVFFGGIIGGWRYSVLLLGLCCVLLGIWAMLFIPTKTYELPGIKSCNPRTRCMS